VSGYLPETASTREELAEALRTLTAYLPEAETKRLAATLGWARGRDLPFRLLSDAVVHLRAEQARIALLLSTDPALVAAPEPW
jgi:hypothetical protein